MRSKPIIALSLCLVIAGLASGQLREEPSPTTAQEKAKSVHAWSAETAKSIKIERRDGKQPANLIGGSLLQWSNPIVGEVYGDCFLWASEGRPVAFLSVYAFFEPTNNRRLTFQSLSESPLTAKIDAHTVWTPDKAGAVWITLGESPTRSNSPAAQQRQLRIIASEYSARIAQANEQAEYRDLRLLTRPLYTYQCKSAQIEQGAVFAFVDGTDPELLLMIELVNKDRHYLRFSPVRQHHRQLSLARDGERIWEAPKIAPPFPNPNISDPQGVYFNTRWDAIQPASGTTPK